ncbi:hypothetical protein HYU12_01330 [Candidatus Woesearchaeota archaeon]|nr:hypothetical protein [Candidatus Woesearchaeota archaeon]
MDLKYGSWKAALLLAAVALAVLLFNSVQIFQLGAVDSVSAGSVGASSSYSGRIDVIPKGVPAVYGKELGVSFDSISVSDAALADATISRLGRLDIDIQLSGAELKRYIAVVSRISCEYCCGAASIIFENGEPACGCAHSYAMRGLAKYLITKHGSEFSDDAILEELGRWKTLFFPAQIAKKAEVLAGQGVELNYINLASNKYRGAEKGAGSGSMVGGC